MDGVFSLIDPELSLLAKERDRFLAIGTTPIVSSYELCEMCLDKFQMYQKLCEMQIPTGKCFVDQELFKEAVAKERDYVPGICEACKRKCQHQHQ